MTNRYYSFNQYLREKFGQRVHKISLDAGFNCPNIDGSLSADGCVYCNNKGFSRYAGSNVTIERQINDSVEYYGKRMGVNKFIAYFQSFTNTYAGVDELREKYDVIRKFPQIAGIFISTRPDSVDEEKLKLIAGYSKDYLVWIEYGLQTTHDRFLQSMNRNHTYDDFLYSLELTRKWGINTGVHVILGIPGATAEDVMADAKRLAKLDIQGIKFHVMHVFKGAALEEAYKKREITLMDRRDYVNLVCDFIEHIPESVVILRLISSASPDYLVAPLWINRKSSVIEEIRAELDKRGTRQGCRIAHGAKSKDKIDCNP